MNKKLLLICLPFMLAMFTISCGRQGGVAVTESEAEIKFDTLSHDFGMVAKDTTVSYEFVFYNIGATPLHLTQVISSCGCTVVDYPKGSVEPGEQASITATYNSHNRPVGHFKKSIRVYSNAKTPFLRLFVSGDIVEE